MRFICIFYLSVFLVIPLVAQEYKSSNVEDNNEKIIDVANVDLKDSLIGQAYEARVRESCARTVDGGYMIYTHCRLRFDVDSVSISNYTSSSRSLGISRETENVKYSWSIDEGKIIIHGFTDYGVLEKQGDTLVGKEVNKTIIFRLRKSVNEVSE